MKKILLSTLAILSLCITSAVAQQKMPNAKVQDQSGKTIETTSLVDGKTPFIVSFWSTTCKPCIKELDALSENYVDWNDEVPFRVVAVSIDDSRSSARAKAFAEGRGWTDFTLLYDPNSDFKRDLNVISTPQVFVFDKDGNQVYAHTGYAPGNEEELFEVIKKLK